MHTTFKLPFIQLKSFEKNSVRLLAEQSLQMLRRLLVGYVGTPYIGPFTHRSPLLVHMHMHNVWVGPRRSSACGENRQKEYKKRGVQLAFCT